MGIFNFAGKAFKAITKPFKEAVDAVAKPIEEGLDEINDALSGDDKAHKKRPSAYARKEARNTFHSTAYASNRRSRDPARGESGWSRGHWTDVQESSRKALRAGFVRDSRYQGAFEGSQKGKVYGGSWGAQRGIKYQRDYMIHGDINRLYDVFDQSYDPVSALDTVGGIDLKTTYEKGAYHTEGTTVRRNNTLFETALQSQKEMSSVFLSSFFN